MEAGVNFIDRNGCLAWMVAKGNDLETMQKRAVTNRRSLYAQVTGTKLSLAREYSFTEAQLTALYGVAIQCPFAGGNAVYKARTMISETGDMLYFDDQTNCALGFYKTEQEEELIPDPSPLNALSVYEVYPNPATDEVTIRYSLLTEDNAYIQVTNALGQLVKSIDLSNKDVETQLDVSSLATGVYHLIFKVGNTNVKFEKLVVTKP